jgi:F-type H+-transporting ATPase subunit b
MPQISQLLLVYQSQWFWLAIVLALIYFFIGKGMVPKIEATVDARDRKIADDLAAAERARAGAEEAEGSLNDAGISARSEAQAIAAKAKDKAAKDAADRLAKADAEISAKLSTAEKALGEARAKALDGIEKVAVEAAQDIVAKVSGAKIGAAQAGAAVKAVLGNA